MRVEWPDNALPSEVEPLLHNGDYSRHPKGSFWMLRAPNGQIGTITPATHSAIRAGGTDRFGCPGGAFTANAVFFVEQEAAP